MKKLVKKYMIKNILVMEISFIAFLFIFSAYMVFGEKVILTECLHPVDIVLDDHQLYVTDEMSIYIYSLKDFKLKKKFGSAGYSSKYEGLKNG